ncbi:putative F-box domain-containing protein [Seiridium cardinale]
MEGLPSYEEATIAPHWTQLIAPYVPMTDWRRCSLVNSRFYKQFAPKLWLDPLITARAYGLHPNDDLAWYRRFISVHLEAVRVSTRELVRSLDFRDFAVVASGLYSTDASERAISNSFKRLPTLFPRLICLLVDGHPEINPESLLATDTGRLRETAQRGLQLLDLAHCPFPLPTRFFQSPYLRDLLYLDISYLPGSIADSVHTSMNPQYLPALRVLKVRNREVEDSTARLLFRTFRFQLWCLDLSDNKLTDDVIPPLINNCFSSVTFRSDAHFAVEGKLTNHQQLGTTRYGPFEFIIESGESASFTHPMRYMSDAPPYVRRGSGQELQEWQVARNTGTDPRRADSAGVISKYILVDSLENTAPSARGPASAIGTGRGGLTHLYLNGNRLSSGGVEELLRLSLGRLEHFECDIDRFPRIIADPNSSFEVRGLFGFSHLFRPVFSSNLRSLRIHHSAVTGIPDVSSGQLPHWKALVYAETSFRQRIEMAYPQALVPDMNPRLTSLTLTEIPSRSTGPLISGITRFLDLASDQQNAVMAVTASSRQRGSLVLNGLRHIRLELKPAQSEDLDNLFMDGDVNFSELLDPASPASEPSSPSYSLSNSGAASDYKPDSSTGRQDRFWHDRAREHVTHRVEASESWNGNTHTIRVWVGRGIPGPHRAVNEYMRNLRRPHLHKNVGPAMPNHVAAGVPPGSYIYHAAWDAMVVPRSLPHIDEKSTLASMRDVAAALKEYRGRTRGTIRHWLGKLELATIPHAI